ncbi:MAG: ATP-binding cassette domain-containing protein [Halothiobacillaceae bacterium]
MNTTAEPLIHAEHLVIQRGGHVVLRDVSLSLRAGQIMTFIGPNGAGKTTLLHALLGLLPASAGKLWRRPGLRIGYIPQQMPRDSRLPVCVDRFLRLVEPADRGARQQALERVGVARLQNRMMSGLSGGELQRVLMARALLRRPQLLALDEPAQGIDLSGQRALYALIRELRDELGCAVVLVSHDLHLVMAATDEVLCLEGHVCCRGRPEDVGRHAEYRRLFGHDLEGLAVYTHHHDHEHALDGSVCPESGCATSTDDSHRTPG